MFLIEYLIKVIDLPASKALTSSLVHLAGSVIVGNLYLIIVVRKYFTNVVAGTFLMSKKRPDSYSYFYFASTVIFMFYFGRTQ
jgi:hypothetical protein